MTGPGGGMPGARELLRSVPLFAACSKSQLARLGEITVEQRFPAGRVICKQGESGIGLHVILEGSAKLQVNGRTRRRVGAGTCFGELSVLDQRPRRATVLAETPVRTLSIPAWDLRALLKAEPHLALTLLEAACARLRAADSSLLL